MASRVYEAFGASLRFVSLTESQSSLLPDFCLPLPRSASSLPRIIFRYRDSNGTPGILLC